MATSSAQAADSPGAAPLQVLPPLLLAGPTAVGKSDLALKLAEELSGEIVSVDSMQVYRGMDIGTAKPALAQRTQVPHHLVDELDLHESFNAARFVTRARQVVAEIQHRGRVPLLCGGTGLYFRAFLQGLDAPPPENPELRAQLQALSLEELLQELRDLAPDRFAAIDRRNPRRVLRAVEILRHQQSGQPCCSTIGGYSGPSLYVVLTRPVPELRERIDQRVTRMFDQGLVEETKKLMAADLKANPTALQALGYRQVVEFLEGKRPLAETIALVQLRTRQFAKRQLTWFRKETGAQWMEIRSNQTDDHIMTELRACYRRLSDAMKSPHA